MNKLKIFSEEKFSERNFQWFFGFRLRSTPVDQKPCCSKRKVVSDCRITCHKSCESLCGKIFINLIQFLSTRDWETSDDLILKRHSSQPKLAAELKSKLLHLSYIKGFRFFNEPVLIGILSLWTYDTTTFPTWLNDRNPVSKKWNVLST